MSCALGEVGTVLMVALVGLAVLTVPLAGGRLGELAGARLRAAGWIFAALAVQIVVISVVPGELPPGLASGLHLATYAAVAAFLWANRRVAGLWVAAVGAGLNALVISVNGGVMPASRHALETAGRLTAGGEFENSAVVADAKLAFLGDVFALPASWPLANVFSVGDVLIVAGAAAVLHALCGSRLAPRARARLQAEARERAALADVAAA